MIKHTDVVKRIRRSDCKNLEDFDIQYNINTAHPTAPTLDGANELRPKPIHNADKILGSSGYEASPLEYLDMLNSELIKDENISNYTFIDIGSGKGKVIFYNLIKNSPYKEYIGIEADKNFNDIALNNLNTFNKPINKNVEFLEMNILDYAAEAKDCVYYFFQPFGKAIFDRFIINNWEVIKNTNSYFVFLFEESFEFSRYIDKQPIYDFAELKIYSLKN